MQTNTITGVIVDAAYKVHTTLGPGLLESVYEIALEHELQQRGMEVERQFPVDVVYDTVTIGEGFKIDLLVCDSVVVELKSVEKLAKVHSKQLLTYLRLADKRVGLLINFGEAYIRDGIIRIANNL